MDELYLKYKDIHDKEARKSLVFTILGSLFLIGAIVSIIIGVSTDTSICLILFIVFLVVAIVLLIVSFVINRSWNKLFKTEILPEIIKSIYPDARFDATSGFQLSRIMSSEFFARPDRYESKNYLSATVENTKFEMADYNLQRETRDSDGHIQYETYAAGKLYIFTFERDFQNVIKVMEKASFLDRQFNGLKVVKMESVDFNKKFYTYASDDLAAFYILTPQIQEQMLYLETQFKGKIYFKFEGHNLFVAVNDNRAAFRFPLSKKFSKENLEASLSEVTIPLRFINAFKLNRDKFSKEVKDKTI